MTEGFGEAIPGSVGFEGRLRVYTGARDCLLYGWSDEVGDVGCGGVVDC